MEKITIKSIKFNGDWANVVASDKREISFNITQNAAIKDAKENDEISIDIKPYNKDGKTKLYGNFPKVKGFVDNKRRDALQMAVTFLANKPDVKKEAITTLADYFLDYLKK